MVRVRLRLRVRLTSCLMFRNSARIIIRISGETYLQSFKHAAPDAQGSKGARVFLFKIRRNRRRRLPTTNLSRGAAPSAGPGRRTGSLYCKAVSPLTDIFRAAKQTGFVGVQPNTTHSS